MSAQCSYAGCKRSTSVIIFSDAFFFLEVCGRFCVYFLPYIPRILCYTCCKWLYDLMSLCLIFYLFCIYCFHYGYITWPHRFLPWAAQERLNRSICRLDCGLGWAEGSTSSIVFARWRQCAQIGATWPIRLHRPSAAAMRSYVKLLWLVSFHSRLMSSLWAAKNS